MRKSTSGFTIVELLIVIVVIAILAAVSVVAYSGVQSRARDADRVNDMRSLKQALAVFYVDNGYYPSVNDIRNQSFRRDTLKITEDIINPPGTSSKIAYCWSTSPSQYCYVGTPGPGGSFDCGDTGEHCIGYRISYRLESDPDTRITMTQNS